jgi:hypothetical protein
MPPTSNILAAAREEFDQLIKDIRPKLQQFNFIP